MNNYTVITSDVLASVMEIKAGTPIEAARLGAQESPSKCDHDSETLGAPWVIVHDESGKVVYDDSHQAQLETELAASRAAHLDSIAEIARLRTVVSGLRFGEGGAE